MEYRHLFRPELEFGDRVLVYEVKTVEIPEITLAALKEHARSIELLVTEEYRPQNDVGKSPLTAYELLFGVPAQDGTLLFKPLLEIRNETLSCFPVLVVLNANRDVESDIDLLIRDFKYSCSYLGGTTARIFLSETIKGRPARLDKNGDFCFAGSSIFRLTRNKYPQKINEIETEGKCLGFTWHGGKTLFSVLEPKLILRLFDPVTSECEFEFDIGRACGAAEPSKPIFDGIAEARISRERLMLAFVGNDEDLVVWTPENLIALNLKNRFAEAGKDDKYGISLCASHDFKHLFAYRFRTILHFKEEKGGRFCFFSAYDDSRYCWLERDGCCAIYGIFCSNDMLGVSRECGTFVLRDIEEGTVLNVHVTFDMLDRISCHNTPVYALALARAPGDRSRARGYIIHEMGEGDIYFFPLDEFIHGEFGWESFSARFEYEFSTRHSVVKPNARGFDAVEKEDRFVFLFSSRDHGLGVAWVDDYNACRIRYDPERVGTESIGSYDDFEDYDEMLAKLNIAGLQKIGELLAHSRKELNRLGIGDQLIDEMNSCLREYYGTKIMDERIVATERPVVRRKKLDGSYSYSKRTLTEKRIEGLRNRRKK